MKTSLFGVLLFVAGAAQGADRPGLMVMDLEAKGATELEAQAATLNVVTGLRALDVFSVLSTDDVRRLLAVERSKALMGAGGDLSDMSAALNAPHAVIGTLTRVGGVYSLELRLMDATGKKGVVSQKTLGPAPSFTALVPQLSGLAQELVGPLLQSQQGSLLVHGRDEGAEVYLDGTLVGSLPLKSALKLSRGAHRLQVKKESFISQTRSVRIEPEELTVEEVTLVPSAAFAQSFREANQRRRLYAYGSLGAAGALLVGAFAVDRLWIDPVYRNELVPRQLALRGQTLTSDQAQSTTLLQVWSGCQADPIACRTETSSLSGQLTGGSWLEGGMVALGVAGLGAGAYLWFTAEDPNRYSGLVASVAPVPGGGAFSLAGHF